MVEFFLTYVLGSGIISIFYSASLSLLIASLHSKYKLEGIKRNNWLGFRLVMKVHPKQLATDGKHNLLRLNNIQELLTQLQSIF